MNIDTIKIDLLNRNFFDECNGKMTFAEGSISRYTKCTVCLSYRLWGDLANEWFYSVRFESFAESGQPEIDHHTIEERYIAESEIAEFCRAKGIETRAERDARRKANEERLRELRRFKMQMGRG
jgi:hypothetical protein